VAETRDSAGFPLLMTAWSIAEATRYIYYALNLYDLVPHFITWCRYSFFIILYPIGVTGELLTIYASLPVIAKKGLYSLPMPNPLNASFYYHYALIGIMASYIPFFPQLYFYMLGQRKKFLGSGGGAKSEAGKKVK
jgi:very-long-chain (3R)-3-hydroxyacyl-CoA dehydratase